MSLRGKASVCTAGQVTYPFALSGTIYGAWANAEGKEIAMDLREQTKEKLARHFRLYSAFHGGDLALDDHKTMFMYFKPDGTLTPSGRCTSPVPESTRWRPCGGAATATSSRCVPTLGQSNMRIYSVWPLRNC
jgi:hypothetical protein